MKELTEKLLSSKSTISVSVDALVHLGLVERKTSVEDRREIKLKLTFEGEELSRKSSQNAYSYRAMVLALDKMNEEDIELLLRLHKDLLSILQKIEF